MLELRVVIRINVESVYIWVEATRSALLMQGVIRTLQRIRLGGLAQNVVLRGTPTVRNGDIEPGGVDLARTRLRVCCNFLPNGVVEADIMAVATGEQKCEAEQVGADA